MKDRVIEIIKSNSPEVAAIEICKLIERAKINALKSIKTPIEYDLLECDQAIKNGRCKECTDPLTSAESEICENCT